MATSLADLADLVALADTSPGSYTMMETALATREFFAARDLRDAGTLGRISYATGEHLQNLDGYPHYWLGYPSMRYSTHALAPLLVLAEARVTRVRCLGSSALEQRGRSASVTRLEPDERPDLVPEALHPHLGGDHGGSHPHLVHAFVGAIADGRAPAVDARMAARITAPGICAHESAMHGGDPVEVPHY
ncbi:hypothetical protein ACSDQ9_06875 [Aestuariimicrobium soli]|uniref:hypothetical protein n=1 Tax=Aestuariimicrobium soli TaxID=2035834 RepID=UPI003EBC7790